MEKNLNTIQANDELSLYDLIMIILKYWYITLGLTVLLTALGLFYGYGVLNDEYQAQTTLVMVIDLENEFISRSDMVDTFNAVIASDLVTTRVAQQLNANIEPSQIRNMVSISGQRNSLVLRIIATSEDASVVAPVANEVYRVLEDLAVNYRSLPEIELLDVAINPRSPSGPNRLIYPAVGLVLGGFSGLFISFTLDYVLKSKELKA